MQPVNINSIVDEQSALELIAEAAKEKGFDLRGSRVIRTSSRACLAVEHGDYNGTELFGFATDKYIWGSYKPTDDGTIRLYSLNFQDEGMAEFNINQVIDPKQIKPWSKFPIAVVKVLKDHNYTLTKGTEGVIVSNIPGGGMSRSASLSINLIENLLTANGYDNVDPMAIADMAQEVELAYGGVCGNLDQIMIMFGKKGFGTLYNPETREIKHIPYGGDPDLWRFVVLDTGTVRPGLEKSRYKIRRRECEELAAAINDTHEYGAVTHLADIKDDTVFGNIIKDARFNKNSLKRLEYIFNAQKRFYNLLEAWKVGDITQVGYIFNHDGIELNELYDISGIELETMCNIARSVPGVLGARMLGGGDKGASGAIVMAGSVDKLKEKVGQEFPKAFAGLAEKYAVHTVGNTDGVLIYQYGAMDKYFK